VFILLFHKYQGIPNEKVFREPIEMTLVILLSVAHSKGLHRFFRNCDFLTIEGNVTEYSAAASTIGLFILPDNAQNLSCLEDQHVRDYFNTFLLGVILRNGLCCET
jgi:hypothetical protein